MTSLWGILQPQARPPISSVSLAVTAVTVRQLCFPSVLGEAGWDSWEASKVRMLKCLEVILESEC